MQRHLEKEIFKTITKFSRKFFNAIFFRMGHDAYADMDDHTCINGSFSVLVTNAWCANNN
jgi:hypothetical protein